MNVCMNIFLNILSISCDTERTLLKVLCASRFEGLKNSLLYLKQFLLQMIIQSLTTAYNNTVLRSVGEIIP